MTASVIIPCKNRARTIADAILSALAQKVRAPYSFNVIVVDDNSIVGGSVQFSMNIDSLSDDDSSLLAKFVEDIVDTLTGDKPIGAAGTEAPDYYHQGEITWKNRRNQ